MPLYELIAIVRPGKIAEVRDIAKSTSTIVLNSGGVIRGITNWGTFLLPRPKKAHRATHHYGHHFIVRFDSSAKTQHTLRRTLALDTRMVGFSVVKMGSTLEQIKDVAGKADWGATPGRS